MTRLFLATTAETARALVDRREELLDDKETVIVLTDRPLDGREGVQGDIICAVDLKAGKSISRYERHEGHKTYREWRLPVSVFLRALKKIQLV
ncbi:MAG TPA: hypothetical protein VGB82_07070 [Alphaproteobacteria bacterium]